MAGQKIDPRRQELGRRNTYLVQGAGAGIAPVCVVPPVQVRTQVVVASERHTTAAGAGVRLTLEAVGSGVAPGAGTEIDKGTNADEFELDSVANTVQYLNIDDTQGALGKNVLEPGQALYTKVTGNPAALVGSVVGVETVELDN